ncbi:MAG: cytochrome c biogenesis protein CcsA [Ferruginibacter sp.]
MEFEGEHLFPGQLGHFFVILAFIASALATVSFFISSRNIDLVQKKKWLQLARWSFLTQVISVFIIFGIILYICSNHLFEYMYAYKHASLELEYKYLLACIWEGQEGSFLLWTIWHSVLGSILIYKAKEWEAPVMTVISFAQFFLLMMILGIYIFDVRIGNSLFTLTRNEIDAPIFLQPNYLTFIKDGMGLNILLRNYWMVIHPPVLFLGFASTLIPFAYAYAGIHTKRYGDWIQPVLPWTLFTACILGVGIMMGSKWAYESLNFGGYWAWDPVENASLVPWLILIAGLHTMVIYKATGRSLRASYLFAFLSFVFVLYSTFLTRTGILGDTSVHSFTEAGKAINTMIKTFLLAFTLPALGLFFFHYKKIPAIHHEEQTNSREFWMFIGSLVFFLTALFIILVTSIPVYNEIPILKDIIKKIHGGKIASPENAEFLYNKVIVMVAIILGLLTATTQYFKYKNTATSWFLKKIAAPAIIAAILTTVIVLSYPLTYQKEGPGFLAAIYIAFYAAVFSVIANGMYIWIGLKGKFRNAGGSVSHFGFALMLVGILVSSSNKKVISSSLVNGINLPAGKDPMTKEEDDPRENLTLIRQLPTRMAEYEVTYKGDSSGHEKGRRFYELGFTRKDPETKKIKETFTLLPDVYMMKDNNMSSNPATRSYLDKDIFTYVSYALNGEKTEDTAQFKEVILGIKDTAFYNSGYLVLNNVLRNPDNERFSYKPTDAALVADITIVNKDSIRFSAMPGIQVIGTDVILHDDTLYAQNLYLRFAGVSDEHKIKIGIKESDKLIDFVTVKSYIFPFINLLWLGLIIMAFGITMSTVKRAAFSTTRSAIVLVLVAIGLIYMFLLAN